MWGRVLTRSGVSVGEVFYVRCSRCSVLWFTDGSDTLLLPVSEGGRQGRGLELIPSFLLVCEKQLVLHL